MSSASLITCFPQQGVTAKTRLFNIVLDGLQCFDAVGWAAGRASGL